MRSACFSRRLGALALLLVAAGAASGSPGPGAAAQPDDSLVVAITSPAPADVLRGRALIRGWAVDVDHPPRLGSGINPRDVQLWLGAYPDGRRLDYARYGEPSDEAQQVFDARYAASGFVAEWETCSFSPGPYDLWTYVSSLASPGAQGYNTVAVTVAPCSAGSELYRGNFADRGAWPALTTASVETLPEADGWTIHQRVAGTSAQGPQGVFANFRASVTARMVGDDFDRYYYLQFRQAPGAGPCLRLGADGRRVQARGLTEEIHARQALGRKGAGRHGRRRSHRQRSGGRHRHAPGPGPGRRGRRREPCRR